ncbi:unnamed protein product [Colias eurytheme]|nr:unnamed protein product [Colias eurytheme]
MHKAAKEMNEQETKKDCLGEAPGVLAKRNIVQPVPWCPLPLADNTYIDPSCDPDNPRKITYKDVSKANALIKEEFSETPLLALAYYGQRLKIPVTVVLPSNSSIIYVGRCHELGAFVVSFGENLDEAKGQAFVMLKKRGQVYING